MNQLAIDGGTPVRAGKQWPVWPIRGEREIELLADVVRSGEWRIGSTYELEFAQRFAAYQGATFGECVANGTCALEIAYAGLGIVPGDEVIVPGLTFVATATAAYLQGAVPVFVDVAPETYQLDAARLEEAITARTKVIVPVHLYSGMADMDAILQVARRHGIPVVEDCAHAHGGRWRGADGEVHGAGSMGDYGTFSFMAGKSLPSAEGGIVITNSARLADLAFSYKHCGRPRAGAPSTRAEVVGWNYRLGALQAAVLLAQLERFDALATQREAGGRYLDEELGKIPGIRPLKCDARVVRRPFYNYIFRYEAAQFGGLPIGRFRAALAAEGLPANETYGAVWENDLWSARDGFRIASGDVTRRVINEGVSIGHRFLLGTPEDLQDIVAAVRKIHEHANALVGVAS
jgi:dTDP-4-amino-4,6-dideoxygalactose transaminase